MKIWILVIEICLEIEDVFKFDSLEAWKGKNKETSGNKSSFFLQYLVFVLVSQAVEG